MTLGKALEIEADESQRGSYWLVLSKKRSKDIAGGELCLGFEVAMLDPQQYHQVSKHLAGSKLVGGNSMQLPTCCRSFFVALHMGPGVF